MVVVAGDAMVAFIVGMPGRVVSKNRQFPVKYAKKSLIIVQNGLEKPAVLAAFLGSQLGARFHLVNQRSVCLPHLIAHQEIMRHADRRRFIELDRQPGDLVGAPPVRAGESRKRCGSRYHQRRKDGDRMPQLHGAAPEFCR